MAINKISEFPKVTPSADDKILIEKNGEGGHINLSEMPVSTPVEDRISEEVNKLNSQINDLAFEPGDTTGDAELRNIRTPADGFTVPPGSNAGNAVRAQVTQLDGKISNLKGDLSKVENDLSDVTETIYSANILPPVSESGYLQMTDGVPKNDSSMHRTPNGIEIPSGITAFDVIARTTFPSSVAFMFYSDATTDTFISVISVPRGVPISTVYIPDGAKTFRISASTSVNFADVCVSTTGTDFEEYSETKAIKTDAIQKHSITFEHLSENIEDIVCRGLNGKTIVNFGDSIFGNFFERNDISSYIANLTGATVYNCGFGGCRMATHNVANYEPFCMHSLAYAIANNDWTAQENAVNDNTWTDKPWYFNMRLNTLKSIDFSKVDIITIAYGTNDFMSDIRQDNEENKLDYNYYKGALRYSIEKILTAYPNIRIVVCTPIYRSWNNADGSFKEDSNTKIDSFNKTLIDFGTSCKEVCAEYNLQYIDNYYIGMGKFTRTHYWDSDDYTHPNENGRKLIAQHIVHKLY